jgi:acyl-[acyl-carrier-protein]-phospholipid O-acyltransferase/long-chain-fatty-acid--[acyl-carrier-protein] ligase
MVGIMLPASVGGVLANLATLMAGKVPVNLNFTAGADALDVAYRECGIRTVLTSKVFLSKAKLETPPGAVFLEDVMKEITGLERLGMLLAGLLLPAALLARIFIPGDRDPDGLATVIFSSGSTGVPKGVMLSHRNIGANVDDVLRILPLGVDDRIMGVLPLFHSFGFTGTIWLALLPGMSAVYHPNPLDAATIGEMVQKHKATMLLSTPSFCLGYARKIPPEQFASLRYSVVGAEKLREPVALAFREKFGVDLLEGYGCTEMAPVVACNRPAVGPGGVRQPGIRPGSVGLPIPGVKAQVVDQHTGEGPLVDREGLLLVHGPNMMVGYLDQPERTSEVMRDGWYVTGDIARIDADGFIHITDRLSRFSKIGGEMVPHLKIEDAINDILGEVCCAVTAVPDDTRGERLVAFYTRRDVAPEALWDQLGDTELPKLWLPRRDNLVPIDEIPALGTGKTDLRRLKEMALALGAGR